MARVAIDLEGVLADLHRAYIRDYNAEYETDHTTDSLDRSYWEWVIEEFDHEAFYDLTDAAWHDHETMPVLEPHANAELTRLRDAGHTPDIVTARTDVDEPIREWLTENDITAFEGFHAVDPDTSKADYEREYDYFVDDKPGLADELGENQHQYLYSQPWNQHVVPHDRATIVSDLHAAVDVLVSKEVATNG